MEHDERVVVFGQDIGRNGGVFRATDGLLERFGADARGRHDARGGRHRRRRRSDWPRRLVPVAEIQFLGFANQAFHQLADQLARYRYRSRRPLRCPVTVRAPFGGGVRTPELHSDALEAQTCSARG